MLRHVLFDMSLFADDKDRENSQFRILWLLQALTNCDRLYLRQHPETPLIYQSGITYKVPQQFNQEDALPEIAKLRQFLTSASAPSEVMAALQSLDSMTGGGEVFREIPRIIENGGGDCDNVASWRAAELCELGIPAKPFITWRRRIDGGMTYHVIVLWPDGSSEDPSLLLGMGGADREKDRKREEEKLGERMGNFIAGLTETRRLKGGTDRLLGLPASSGLPSDFGKGLQYTIPFQTDDSYEAWSPSRPPQFYADPRYPGGGVQNTPFFNTLMRDPDDDDRFDGVEATPFQQKRWARELRKKLGAA